MIDAVLKDPSADRHRILAPLKTRLEMSPPAKAVERLTVEFCSFTPGPPSCSSSLATRMPPHGPAGSARCYAVQEIKLRLRRSPLYHIIEVQPWSRIPERRYALIDYEP
jgi:DNA polymerase-4/protein ImuB